MTHEYEARLEWTGNTGSGTAAYAAYGREYRIAVDGKPDLAGSADPMFRGNAALHNPEDLFLAAIAACHMLTYLALCARHGVRVLGYRDTASGALVLEPGGGGRFARVTLRPQVRVADMAHVDPATRLHADAHARCFIAGSCSVPIACDATVHAAPTGDGRSA